MKDPMHRHRPTRTLRPPFAPSATVTVWLLAIAGCSAEPPGPTASLGELLQPLGLDTLDTAVVAADLDDDLLNGGPFTLFGPTDAAFAELPTGLLDSLLEPVNQAQLIELLDYHLLASSQLAAPLIEAEGATTIEGSDVIVDLLGNTVYVNDARILVGNIGATNGTLHGLDSVLRVPRPLLTTLTDRGLTDLSDLLVESGLDATLAGPGPFTLIAPTNVAIQAAESTLAPLDPAELADLLAYHLVVGSVRASDGASTGEVESEDSDDDTLLFAESDGQLTVNGVTVSAINIPCTNGVLYVVPEVLTDPVAPATGPSTPETGPATQTTSIAKVPDSPEQRSNVAADSSPNSAGGSLLARSGTRSSTALIADPASIESAFLAAARETRARALHWTPEGGAVGDVELLAPTAGTDDPVAPAAFTGRLRHVPGELLLAVRPGTPSVEVRDHAGTLLEPVRTVEMSGGAGVLVRYVLDRTGPMVDGPAVTVRSAEEFWLVTRP